MHTGNHYKLSEFIIWTKRDIVILIGLATVPTLLYKVGGLEWLAIPWVPTALVGTAAAFIIGFKNTQTYNRLWEARQIWGAIVNSSRAWGIMVLHFVKHDENVKRELIYRHIAWMTALRFQLREPRTWENMDKANNKEYQRFYTVAERNTKLEEELAKYLSTGELTYLLTKKNRATQTITLQSKQLMDLKKAGAIDAFEYVEMERRLADLYDQQGKCERIKNFPYPRQFSSIGLFFTWLFACMLPFGMLNEFGKLGPDLVWLTIPFSVIVSWVFTCMERVGEATANPFEGSANDVPVTALCRTIEIDLRDMLDEKELPLPITPTNMILT